MSSDDLLLRIQQAGKDKDAGIPGADKRLEALLRKLRRRGVAHLKRPNPPKTLKEGDE